MGRKKRRLKKKVNKIIYTFLLVVSLFFIIYNLYKIYFIVNQNNQTNNLLNELVEDVKNEEEVGSENTLEKEQENTSTYYDILKLKEMNSDTVGWIDMDTVNISYPLVQTKDNYYYLKYSFDKKRNGNGWVFMDYRNDSELEDKNTVIYAHNTLFKSIRKRFDSKDSSSFKINVYKETKKYVYEVFSQYLALPKNVELIDKNISSDILNNMKNSSSLDFNINVMDDDRILTVVTCYYDNTKRLITHAKLIDVVNIK